MDSRQDSPLSHVVSWGKKIIHVKHSEKIYPSLGAKAEYLFDIRDSVKEGITKELMVGTKRTKERREWLIRVREFEIRAKNLLKFHEKTSDNLRLMKQSNTDLMNMLDEITHLLESVPLQRATKTMHFLPNEGKTFRPAERVASYSANWKTGAKGRSYMDAGTSHVTKKEAGKRKESMTDINFEPETLVSSSFIKPEGDQPFVSMESQEINQGQQSLTKVGPIIDLPPPMFGNYGDFSDKTSLAGTESLLSTESNVGFVERKLRSSSQSDVLPGSELGTDLISFEEEIKPSLPSKIPQTMHTEIEEISSSDETEVDTGSREAISIPDFINIRQSVEPTIEVGASTSGKSNLDTVKPFAVISFGKDEILLTDESKTIDHCQNEDKQGFYKAEVDAKTTVERTVLEMVKLLNYDTFRRIGLYGIGGLGKTTVLKGLINYPKIKDMFDLIIWVTASKCCSIRKIQEEVLRQLSMKDEFLGRSPFPLSKIDSEIAEQLLQYLEGKKFLLLLDDVWEGIDLKAVGIPDPNLENRCALIMATRKLEVCDDMHLVNVIKMETMSEEEAWELFHEQVGGIVDAPGIKSFAQSIVERCGGLPLLVIVTGRALSREEDVCEWEQASKQFSELFVRDSNNIIQMLKFSFDRLKFHIQSCFLHCALVAADKEVEISELVKYYIKEGLISGSIVNAYKRGHDIVTVLINAFFLESTNNHSIKMHDMMRDLALGILSKEESSQFLLKPYSEALNRGNYSMVGPHESLGSSTLFIPDSQLFLLRAASSLTEPPSLEEWGNSKMIFLMDNKLSTLPERPSCPELLTLFLQRNSRLRVIPMSFFDCMPCLKVLNLSQTRIKCLPKTISKLISLENLILCHCERLVMLPPDIGSLKLLQVLDLRGTEINMLPDEIGELASLKYLDVCFYGSINRSEYVKLPHGLISSGIITRLHALESLRIIVCPGDERWEKCIESMICEMSKLTELKSLTFYFPEVAFLEQFLQRSVAWIDQCLTEYNIIVGHDIKRIVSRVPHDVELDYSLMGRCLKFVNGEKIPDSIVEVVAHSSAFYLDHHLDISSISKFGIDNISKLKFCIVSECPAIKAILDCDEYNEVVFPWLEHLSLHYLWNLEYIYKGFLPEGSFAMLRTLFLHACPKLKYVFKISMLQLVSNLEELIVDDCTAMEKIIFDDKTTEMNQMWCSKFKRLTLHYLPALDNIGDGAWPMFEYINVNNCPNLKIDFDMELKKTLKEIKGDKDWWDALNWKEPSVRRYFEDLFTPVSEDDTDGTMMPSSSL